MACPSELKARGQCYEADGYDPNKDGNKNIIGTSDAVVLANAKSVDLYSDREVAARVTKDGNFEVLKSTYKYVGETIETYVSVPNDGKTEDFVHSHPLGDDWGPDPGPRDGLENGHANYIVRDRVRAVVELVNGQYQYRVIRGKLNMRQRALTQARLNAYRDAARAKKKPCD